VDFNAVYKLVEHGWGQFGKRLVTLGEFKKLRRPIGTVIITVDVSGEVGYCLLQFRLLLFILVG
jgi:hypothetical protein